MSAALLLLLSLLVAPQSQSQANFATIGDLVANNNSNVVIINEY